MLKKIKSFVGLLIELFKVKITFAVSLTTILGFVLYSRDITLAVIYPTLGIFILACASAALNHYQEASFDSKMERTKGRPIPSGRISAKLVLFIAFVLTIGGSWMLFDNSGFLTMQLGLFALIWYNGIYTPLKRKTAFAVVPGSLIGALPPLVGWTAAGGSIADLKIIFIAFFYFMWQIPHFWLLQLKFSDDYEKAGFPTLKQKFSEQQIKNITFVWITSTAVTCIFLPFYRLVSSQVISVLLIVAAIMMIILFRISIFKEKAAFNSHQGFIRINIFMLVILLLMFLDAILILP